MAEPRLTNAPNYPYSHNNSHHPPPVPNSAQVQYYHAHNQHNQPPHLVQQQHSPPPQVQQQQQQQQQHFRVAHVDPNRSRPQPLHINTAPRPPHMYHTPQSGHPSQPPPPVHPQTPQTPQTPQSPYTPYFGSTAQEKQVRDSIIEVLSSTANGCIRELGYPNLYDQHENLEQAYATLVKDNQNLQARYNELYNDNIHSSKLLFDQKEENRRRAERENQLIARIKQLEQELDVVNRQYQVSIKLQSMGQSDAYKVIEAKYQYVLEMLKKHHAPLVARVLSEEARASIKKKPVLNGARVPDVIDLTRESEPNASTIGQANNNSQRQFVQGSSTRPPPLPIPSQATPSASSTVVETIHTPFLRPTNHSAEAGPSNHAQMANIQVQSTETVPAKNVSLLARSVKRALTGSSGAGMRVEKRRKESVQTSATHPSIARQLKKQAASSHHAASTLPTNQPHPGLAHQQKLIAMTPPQSQQPQQPQETQSLPGTPTLATSNSAPISATNPHSTPVATQAQGGVRPLSAPPLPAPVLYTPPSQNRDVSSSAPIPPGLPRPAPTVALVHKSQSLWEALQKKHGGNWPQMQPQAPHMVPSSQQTVGNLSQSVSANNTVQISGVVRVGDQVHTPQKPRSESPAQIPATAAMQPPVTKPPTPPPPAPQEKGSQPGSTTPIVEMSTPPSPKPAPPISETAVPSVARSSEGAKEVQSGPTDSASQAPLTVDSAQEPLETSVQAIQEPGKDLAEPDDVSKSVTQLGIQTSLPSEAPATNDMPMDVDESANPPVVADISVKNIVLTEIGSSNGKDMPDNGVPDTSEAPEEGVNEDEEEDEDEEEETWDDLTDDEDGAKQSVPDCVSTIFYDDDNDERLCHFCNARLEKLNLSDPCPTFSESTMRDLISHSKEEHPITWKKLRTESRPV